MGCAPTTILTSWKNKRRKHKKAPVLTQKKKYSAKANKKRKQAELQMFLFALSFTGILKSIGQAL